RRSARTRCQRCHLARSRTRRRMDSGRLTDEQRRELSEQDARIIEAARPYTMAGFERQIVLLQAVAYLERRRVPGAYAECGVWRGGSVLAMVLKLLDLGVQDRDVYLYDTFEGMTDPTELDTSHDHQSAVEEWRGAQERGERLWP